MFLPEEEHCILGPERSSVAGYGLSGERPSCK